MPIRKTMRRSGGYPGLPIGHARLHGNRTGDGVDNRTEFDNRTVTQQLNEASFVLGQQRITIAGAALLIIASVPVSSVSIRRE